MGNAIAETWKSVRTMEGAGVRLKRAFGNYQAESMDPFLLLDNFGSDDPADYTAGFPWHPHRGIETVTYMLAGDVDHGDSLGNRGTIGTGDVQWMTAGSGIIHQEMPQPYEGAMRGFQLWVNLPAKDKMMNPRYRGILADEVPELEVEGAKIKVVAGDIAGTRGPVRDLVIDTVYFDVEVQPGARSEIPVAGIHTVFAYVFEGSVSFREGNRAEDSGTLVLFEKGDSVNFAAGNATARFLLVSGEPLGEPIAWRGPIVMNTEKELDLAFREYRDGTFIKHDAV
ncbi:MAG TPA: pirin family protein [Candidatus Anoxymicrobiaceae bacterium]